jgi:hypothetical protein
MEAAMVRLCACVMLAALWALPAAAQSNQPPAPRPDPRACAPGERLQPGERGPSATTGQGENPSDKLARTDGVICPPNVDPQIESPPAETGKTPVLPPPGSPGGDPTVRPK